MTSSNSCIFSSFGTFRYALFETGNCIGNSQRTTIKPDLSFNFQLSENLFFKNLRFSVKGAFPKNLKLCCLGGLYKEKAFFWNGQKVYPVFEWKLVNAVIATITRCDLSATILFRVVDSYLIAFKFAQ